MLECDQNLVEIVMFQLIAREMLVINDPSIINILGGVSPRERINKTTGYHRHILSLPNLVKMQF